MYFVSSLYLCVFNLYVQQDVDDDHLRAVDLALELEDLMGKLDFLRVGYDEVIMGFISFSLYSALFFSCLLCEARTSLTIIS